MQKNYMRNEMFSAAAITCGIFGALAFVIYDAIRSNITDDYVITAKDANKIEYYSIKNPADTHVMTFDGDTVLKRGGWYPYLSVGDTITGPAFIMNEPVAKSTRYYGMRPPILTTTIEYKNGKSLSDWHKIAQRDSIHRTMRQNQR